MTTVVIDGITIRMKVTSGRAKPEFDDVALAAAKTGAPLHEVASRAEEAWRAGAPSPSGSRPLPRLMANPMFHYDEAMTDLILAACRERLVHGPGRPRLRRPGRVARPGARRADAPRGQRRRRRAEALRRQAVDRRRVLRQPALPLVHPGGARPRPRCSSTCSSRAPPCTARRGSRRPVSWSAENQALGVLAAAGRASPTGAGGCFVAGGSAGNLSALMVARDTAGAPAGDAVARTGPSSPSARTPTRPWARPSTCSASAR